MNQTGGYEGGKTLMREVMDFVKGSEVYFLLGLSVVSLFLLIYTICVSRKLAAVTRRHRAKLPEGDVGEIVNSIMEHSEELAGLQGRMDELKAKHADHRDVLTSCVQKMGIVRFNAFEDVGGEQSFALVLLDANSNGIAISSIYGRQDSRMYVKGIANGEGERALSDEERRALSQALTGQGMRSRVGAPIGR